MYIVSDIQNNFCTKYFLQKEELLTKIYLYCNVQSGGKTSIKLLNLPLLVNNENRCVQGMYAVHNTQWSKTIVL